MSSARIEFLSRLAKGLACEFGSNCEVVIHDLEAEDLQHTVVAIENGHVSGRNLGDGPSNVVLQSLRRDPEALKDRYAYITRTEDGRILKSTTIFYREEDGNPSALLSINFDITMLIAAQSSINALTAHEASAEENAPTIPHNVSDLLDDLIEQSVKLVGKPVALMNKAERIKAIGFLNDAGAFLVRQSSQKVCSYFGISKYTLYSYLDEAKAAAEQS
ncbi:transcriptional regulator [Olsenella sp. KGMB02461]|nr:transcriptional regulator [Olsenella sp. KGMB02461]